MIFISNFKELHELNSKHEQFLNNYRLTSIFSNLFNFSNINRFFIIIRTSSFFRHFCAIWCWDSVNQLELNIQDRQSTNGTVLNGSKLVPGK